MGLPCGATTAPLRAEGCRGEKFPVKTRLQASAGHEQDGMEHQDCVQICPSLRAWLKRAQILFPPMHLVTASSRKVSAATSPPPELSLVQMPRACPAPQKWSRCGRRSTPRWKPTRSRSTPSSQGGECPQRGSSPPAWGWVQQRARGRS